MSQIYDNWERLVAAVLKKEQLWQLFHDHSRSPSILSEALDLSSSFDLSSLLNDVPFDFLNPGSSSSVAKSGEGLPKLVFTAEFSPTFGLEDLLRASTEYIGEGTFGSVYVATLDNGIRVVVKRLKPVSVSEPQFRRHMEIVGSIRDVNIATLKGYYSFKDEKLLLYDYYNWGNLSQLLLGRNGLDRARVDWPTRLRIALGAARGIAHIHAQNSGQLVHGNIKSCNIFISSERYGWVSDIGLADVITTTFTPTARCYAPEVKNTQNVSQASDVYSFGVLLLELLTRRSPVQVRTGGHAAVDLVKLVNSVSRSRDRMAKIFDIDLLKDTSTQKEVVKMLQIGISCAAKSPKKRPKISEVVRMIENFTILNTVSQISKETERNKMVFFKGGDDAFGLEDLLRASADVLGKGNLGTSYKAILETGIIVVVKRLREVIVPKEEFQQHMEVIGRILRHNNVAELRAYYSSTDEKLLVYDYYMRGSLSAMLHRSRRFDREPFDWKTRLKFALGAARGVAHIHRQEDGKLVHGNIRVSNIFLDEQQYVRIADAGLATILLSPTRMPLMWAAGYRAPEVTDIKKISQPSDVYSFGVVLLELISGKQPTRHVYVGETVSLTRWFQSVSREKWVLEGVDIELLRYQHDKEAVVQVLQMAMECVATVPEDRPKMVDVVRKLEEISEVETASSSSVKSRLEDLLMST